MTVILIGSEGFIGSNLASLLIDRGIAFVGIDMSPKRSSMTYKFISGDYCMCDEFDELLKSTREKFDVIHLAALNDVRRSICFPEEYLAQNAGKPSVFYSKYANLWNSITYSSTCTLYDAKLMGPIRENDEISPISPYARSKLMFENFLSELSQSHQIRTTSLRLFNVIGRLGFQELYGNRHSTRIVSRLLHVIAGRQPVFQIFGNSFSTHDGTAVRDYIAVEDVANVLLQVVSANSPELFRVFNIGSGVGKSVLEVVDAFSSVSGKLIPVEFHPSQQGDVACRIADTTLYNAAFNAEPGKINFLQIVKRILSEN